MKIPDDFKIEYDPIVGDGRNKDCEPMEVIWQEDYSMMVPVCPKCKELAFTSEYDLRKLAENRGNSPYFCFR